MRCYFATACSQALWEQALRTDQVFDVHSVFPSGVNLMLGERLLYIGSDRAAMRPFGVLLREPQLFSLLASCRQGDGGVYQRERKRLVWGSGMVLDLSEADMRSGLITGEKRGADWAASSLRHLSRCWEKHKPAYGLAQEFPQREQLISSLKGVVCEDPMDAPRQLDFWIGRGPGLTPSGDDLLVGLMAVLHWAGRSCCCKPILAYLQEKGRARTTAVSFEYLYYAAQGIFSQEILELLRAMTEAGPCGPAFSRLLAVGHSSGADTILGMLAGLELFM